MTRYWVIAPYDSTKPEVFDKAWEYDLKHGTIAVGWTDLGDLSGLTKAELAAKYTESRGDSVTKSSATRDINALWAFQHELSTGDVVVARRGTKRIVGIGIVTGSSYYNPDKGKERVPDPSGDAYPRFVPVKWEEKEIEFDRIVFSFYTIYEIPEQKYRALIPEPTTSTAAASSAEFALEKHLEDFLVKNFDGVFGGELKLHYDQDGAIAQQYPIVDSNSKEIGRIDILAREPSSGAYVVIELKKGRESDKVVGQTLRYMGWIAENERKQGEPVKGLIICKEADERLTYALKMVQDLVKVKIYTVDFQLKDLA